MSIFFTLTCHVKERKMRGFLIIQKEIESDLAFSFPEWLDSITLEQKQIKIQNTEGIRIEAKKRIWCSVLNQHSRLLCSLVKQYNTIASLMKTIFVGCFSPLCIKTFEKGGNQMWGITGINFRTSIVFNLLFFFKILFADDTNLFMSHKNLNALIVQMNRELKVEGD